MRTVTDAADARLAQALEGLDEGQSTDLVEVAGAFRNGLHAGKSEIECYRLALAAYRRLHPDDVDDAVTHSVGRILSIADDWIRGGDAL